MSIHTEAALERIQAAEARVHALKQHETQLRRERTAALDAGNTPEVDRLAGLTSQVMREQRLAGSEGGGELGEARHALAVAERAQREALNLLGDLERAQIRYQQEWATLQGTTLHGRIRDVDNELAAIATKLVAVRQTVADLGLFDQEPDATAPAPVAPHPAKEPVPVRPHRSVQQIGTRTRYYTRDTTGREFESNSSGSPINLPVALGEPTTDGSLKQ